jgi:hypothetical protein
VILTVWENAGNENSKDTATVTRQILKDSVIITNLPVKNLSGRSIPRYAPNRPGSQ